MKSGLKNLINSHFQLYPKMQIQDLYKLIYQSVMGPKHILQNEEIAFYYLKNEMENCIGNEKNLFVNIGLKNNLVRVNLNIFRKQIDDIEKLFSVMQKTAENIQSEKIQLKIVLEEIKILFKKNNLKLFQPSNWINFIEKLERKNFPHISHSEVYKKNYFPSYRVILKEIFLEKFNHELQNIETF